MESKGTKKHTRLSVIKNIDTWYKEEADSYLNKVNFGVGSKNKTDIKKYRFLKAFDNILCRNMKCDFEITKDLLESVNIYTKTSTFKHGL